MNDMGDATISTTFQPSLRIDNVLPDVILISSNNVYFYAHRHRIINVSSNLFGGLLLFDPGTSPHGFLPTLNLPESGDVINVVLHTVYGLSCTHFHPTLETVEAALDALIKYGVSLQIHAAPRYRPLHQLLLSRAPYRPIDTYALAGKYELDELAVTVSGHLLSFDLSRITDDLATKMGPVYLKRLFLLHQTRLHALKQILLNPPAGHPPKPGCSLADQSQLTRAWALATAQLVWDATPSLSPNSLRTILESIAEKLSCETCRHMLRQRVQEVVNAWSVVTATI
ncbi:hypothetical protein C8Q77DRAFT_1157545 [Trametes polyzona]|nr:hypothetical protein C8Q77DRAFT_1157545 [Trametes polyzona]